MSATPRITSTAYARPYRPRSIRLANAVGRGLARFGLEISLAPESLLAAAERRNGLSDFGDSSFLAPMRRLLEAIEGEAELSPIGRFITRERLVGVLGNRLRAEQLFREHPEILDQELAPPIVITGLQRTGTTLLHRLLAADPDNRALASWEAVNPAPFAGWAPGLPDRRVRIARWAERSLSFLAPDFFAVHPVEAEAPEEDSILLDFSFLSPVAEATLRVPSYSRWLKSEDLRPAYRAFERLLKLLQWQRPGRRFVLKTPAHLPYLDVLLEVFPGATILHTHRDPTVTLASYCSMIAHGRGVFSDHIDPVALGEELLEQQGGMLLKAVQLRGQPAIERAIIDLPYRELIADPVAQLARVYERIGVPFAAHDAVTIALRHNRQHRFGKHRYALASFGLSAERVSEVFAPYYAHYGLSPEPPSEDRGERTTSATVATVIRAPALDDRYASAVGATFWGIVDLFRRRPRIGTLGPDERLDGKLCLVTGANRGLGRAVAQELVRRGARVMMAGRTLDEQVRREVEEAAGPANPHAPRAELEHLDLTDLSSVRAFCGRMQERGTRFDVVVLNAGVVAREARRTVDGFEEMFQVNYLANFVLGNELVARGLLAEETASGPARIVFVSSEAHRSAGLINWDRLGRFEPYGMTRSVAEYGRSKLLLTTYATELARRLRAEGKVQAAVYALCPGPVSSGIAREAPAWSQPLVRVLFSLFFRRPELASEPVVYLCCARALKDRTGVYLHLMQEMSVSAAANDLGHGKALWQASEALVREAGQRSQERMLHG